MPVNDFSQNEFMDLFANPGDVAPTQQPPISFGQSTPGQVDIFGTPVAPEPVTPAVDPATVEVTPGAQQQPPADPATPPADKDILADAPDPAKPGAPAELKDLSSYFEERLKNGKFVKVEEDLEDGTKRTFIPKTAEEFDEVIDIQVNHRVNEHIKEVEQQWYAEKSPAWQMVAKYAEMTNDPAEILPFIQGVKTHNTVSDLDPKEIDQAEKIVRTRLEQRGDEEDVISETIDSLKTTDKLTSTAEKYKPLILAQEKQQLSQMVQQKREQEQEYNNLVVNIRNNAIKAIDAPFVGSLKLKQEEKADIYDLIAEPDRETKGYRIYSEIDKLFENNDFETLKQVALLLKQKEAFHSYIGTSATTKSAEKLQRTLRVAAESQAAGKDSQDAGDQKTVRRTQYNTQPRFGR